MCVICGILITHDDQRCNLQFMLHFVTYLIVGNVILDRYLVLPVELRSSISLMYVADNMRYYFVDY